MRKLLASVAGVLAFAPITLAFAANDDVVNKPAADAASLASPVSSRERAQLRREAHRKLKAASKRAKGEKKVKVPPQLESIAQCESHGDLHAIGGGGAYRGKYQFNASTWASVGGKGDPASAPEAEQDKRAAMLYARSGAGQWPVCGRQ
jgi:transglycosylase-like protein